MLASAISSYWKTFQVKYIFQKKQEYFVIRFFSFMTTLLYLLTFLWSKKVGIDPGNTYLFWRAL